MPDIPLEIEGNSQEFTIHLPDLGGQRTFQVDPPAKGKLTLSPNVDSLRILVTNGQGLAVALPLGTGWKVRIEEEDVKPAPLAGGEANPNP